MESVSRTGARIHANEGLDFLSGSASVKTQNMLRSLVPMISNHVVFVVLLSDNTACFLHLRLSLSPCVYLCA